MIASRLAIILALLLAAGGWALYRQIAHNGELQERLRAREIELQESERKITLMATEMAERDKAVAKLEEQIRDFNDRAAEIRTVVRKVYVRPDVQPWAETRPPDAVAAAVRAGIDCLWQRTDTPAAGDCGDLATPSDDGGLPAS